jgi:hypothetical protein
MISGAQRKRQREMSKGHMESMSREREEREIHNILIP